MAKQSPSPLRQKPAQPRDKSAHPMYCGCCCFSHEVFATPRTVARQAPLSIRFPRQEYWRGLLFPAPGDLPDPGIKPASHELVGGFFTV